MYNVEDNTLMYLQPKSISEKEYKDDIEKIASEGAYHSDEISETDDDKAREEIATHIRPKNKAESDMHVIKVYDKPWRSKRV